MRFLWAEGVKSAEIHCRMLAQYGARIRHQRNIYKWIERFKEGRTSVTDGSLPGRPSTSHTGQHVQRVDAFIREYQWLSLARVAQVRLAWWCPASGADVASWATGNLVFRRAEEDRWTISEVHHCAGGLCRNLHQWKSCYLKVAFTYPFTLVCNRAQLRRLTFLLQQFLVLHPYTCRILFLWWNYRVRHMSINRCTFCRWSLLGN
jgi:hypothetical protein